MTFAAEFGTGQVLWSLLWLAVLVLVAALFVTLFADIVRSDDLTGWAKALWTLGLLVLPFFGTFVYLTVRGDSMSGRLVARGLKGPIDPVGGSAEHERFRLTALHDAGEITDAELDEALSNLGSDA